MIVAIHQPNLFPWLGFFDKLAHADVFILMDNVQFTKRWFQNRVQVNGPNGAQWLTVPVKTKGRYDQLTRDVEINDEFSWKKEHLKTFATIYKRSPGFPKIMPQLEQLYQQSFHKLVDLTIPGIKLMKKELGIRTELVLASDLPVSGSRSQLLCDMVLAIGGTTYLSGPSGKKYLDESVFAEKGVSVEYHLFEEKEYRQQFGGFTRGMSALDYLFNNPDTPFGNYPRE